MIKILVIDDEIGNRHTDYHQDFVKKYSDPDFQFVFCDGRNENRQYTIQTVLNFVRQNLDADIIILDRVFGDQNQFGVETLGRIRELSPNIPVVMHSSELDSDTRTKCTFFGAAGFLKKGITVEKFREEIFRLVKSK
ncbi:response regulator [Patescibacteria group bacterium]|nr:response regulator [Patescibacteria group bacterium]MBU4512236.1 response regulator [Patescibacteria group bacterium]MCG2692654.1 response regulator [Candidatus Parcubacteria bacterium]